MISLVHRLGQVFNDKKLRGSSTSRLLLENPILADVANVGGQASAGPSASATLPGATQTFDLDEDNFANSAQTPPPDPSPTNLPLLELTVCIIVWFAFVFCFSNHPFPLLVTRWRGRTSGTVGRHAGGTGDGAAPANIEQFARSGLPRLRARHSRRPRTRQPRNGHRTSPSPDRKCQQRRFVLFFFSFVSCCFSA